MSVIDILARKGIRKKKAKNRELTKEKRNKNEFDEINDDHSLPSIIGKEGRILNTWLHKYWPSYFHKKNSLDLNEYPFNNDEFKLEFIKTMENYLNEKRRNNSGIYKPAHKYKRKRGIIRKRNLTERKTLDSDIERLTKEFCQLELDESSKEFEHNWRENSNQSNIYIEGDSEMTRRDYETDTKNKFRKYMKIMTKLENQTSFSDLSFLNASIDDCSSGKTSRTLDAKNKQINLNSSIIKSKVFAKELAQKAASFRTKNSVLYENTDTDGTLHANTTIRAEDISSINKFRPKFCSSGDSSNKNSLENIESENEHYVDTESLKSKPLSYVTVEIGKGVTHIKSSKNLNYESESDGTYTDIRNSDSHELSENTEYSSDNQEKSTENSFIDSIHLYGSKSNRSMKGKKELVYYDSSEPSTSFTSGNEDGSFQSRHRHPTDEGFIEEWKKDESSVYFGSQDFNDDDDDDNAYVYRNENRAEFLNSFVKLPIGKGNLPRRIVRNYWSDFSDLRRPQNVQRVKNEGILEFNHPTRVRYNKKYPNCVEARNYRWEIDSDNSSTRSECLLCFSGDESNDEVEEELYQSLPIISFEDKVSNSCKNCYKPYVCSCFGERYKTKLNYWDSASLPNISRSSIVSKLRNGRQSVITQDDDISSKSDSSNMSFELYDKSLSPKYSSLSDFQVFSYDKDDCKSEHLRAIHRSLSLSAGVETLGKLKNHKHHRHLNHPLSNREIFYKGSKFRSPLIIFYKNGKESYVSDSASILNRDLHKRLRDRKWLEKYKNFKVKDRFQNSQKSDKNLINSLKQKDFSSCNSYAIDENVQFENEISYYESRDTFKDMSSEELNSYLYLRRKEDRKSARNYNLYDKGKFTYLKSVQCFSVNNYAHINSNFL